MDQFEIYHQQKSEIGLKLDLCSPTYSRSVANELKTNWGTSSGFSPCLMTAESLRLRTAGDHRARGFCLGEAARRCQSEGIQGDLMVKW